MLYPTELRAHPLPKCLQYSRLEYAASTLSGFSRQKNPDE